MPCPVQEEPRPRQPSRANPGDGKVADTMKKQAQPGGSIAGGRAVLTGRSDRHFRPMLLAVMRIRRASNGFLRLKCGAVVKGGSPKGAPAHNTGSGHPKALWVAAFLQIAAPQALPLPEAGDRWTRKMSPAAGVGGANDKRSAVCRPRTPWLDEPGGLRGNLFLPEVESGWSARASPRQGSLFRARRQDSMSAAARSYPH